jgi:putative FmdB family regulatory protein
MAIFDFHCADCSQTVEILVLGNSPATCPRCGGERLQKLPSAPAPIGKSRDIISRARARAAREGHFSHYSPAERPRRS